MKRYHASMFLSAFMATLCISAPVGSSANVTAEPPPSWALSTPKPDCPKFARLRRGSGYFKLRVIIKTGQVKEVTTVQSTGDKAFDDTAIRTLSQWRFKPGMVPPNRPPTKDRLADQEYFIKVPITFDCP
jgi:TonB family protein